MTINTLSDSLNIGSRNTVSGEYSFAQGLRCTASGKSSHAEGNGTIANGESSHAEGLGATASGMGSHAEGQTTMARGAGSHAEGVDTLASGDYSHSEGVNTCTFNLGEHANGSGNKSIMGEIQDGFVLSQDPNATLFSVGNGYINSNNGQQVFSNALEIKWNGDIYVKKNDGTTIKLQDLLDKIV